MKIYRLTTYINMEESFGNKKKINKLKHMIFKYVIRNDIQIRNKK